MGRDPIAVMSGALSSGCSSARAGDEVRAKIKPSARRVLAIAERESFNEKLRDEKLDDTLFSTQRHTHVELARWKND